MAKTLYLVRHAEASSPRQGNDFERQLTSQGRKDAEYLSNILKSKNIHPQIWVASSAVRTQETLQIFRGNLGLDNHSFVLKDELYESSTKMYLNEIEKLDNTADSAIIFGHNPVLSELIEYLVQDTYANLIPCTLYEILFPNADSWMEITKDSGKIEQVIMPEQS